MQSDYEQALLSLAAKLKKLPPLEVKALIGFDGFVDEIVHVVDKRKNANEYSRLGSMAEYGRKIENSSGLSMNFEMVTITRKLGGNGPIFANALLGFDFDITYVGALGVPDIHPVFSDMASRCRSLAIADPGRTDAIEFFDGKIISTKMETLKDVNWSNLLENLGMEELKKLVDECSLLGFENWTMLPYMSDIWEHILSEVLPGRSKDAPEATIFFDLADPEKRDKGDILKALELMGKFGEYYRTVLGLNEREAHEIAEALGLSDKAADLETMARYIFSKADLDILVIHPVKEACMITDEGYYAASGPFCEFPKLTTGAGDNFNAGFVLGVMAGLGGTQALAMGMAASGFYVRYARSPDAEELIGFLEDWARGRLDREKDDWRGL